MAQLTLSWGSWRRNRPDPYGGSTASHADAPLGYPSGALDKFCRGVSVGAYLRTIRTPADIGSATAGKYSPFTTAPRQLAPSEEAADATDGG